MNENPKQILLAFFEERFGMPPSLFEPWRFYAGSKGRIFIGAPLLNLPIVAPGLLAGRVHAAIKPSSMLIQLFGRHATKNIVMVSKEHAQRFLNGGQCELNDSERGTATDGYVIVLYETMPLGCGFLRGALLVSLLPKAKRAAVTML